MSQHISVIGQIATEPKLFTPAGGAEFCTFRLASSDRRFDAATGAWVDGHTNWFTVNTFRGLARHAKQAFKKGDRVVFAGKLRLRDWEHEGKRGTAVEVDAEGVGHDVRFGVTAFLKASEVAAGPTPDDGGAGAGGGERPEAPGEVDIANHASDVGEEASASEEHQERSDDGFTPRLASA